MAKKVVLNATSDVWLFLDRGLEKVYSVLIPEAGGLHVRMGLRFANDLAAPGACEMVLLRVI